MKAICILCTQPYVDFGLKVLGGDIMAIPVLYQFVQVLLFLTLKF